MDKKYETLFRRAQGDQQFQSGMLLADGDAMPGPAACELERCLVACVYYGYLLGQFGAAYVHEVLADRPFVKGERVRYIPNHAKGDFMHPDCKDGVVRREGEVAGTLFVLYDNLHGRMETGDEPFTAQCTLVRDLMHLPPTLEDESKKPFDPSTL